jgi:hypothetical protein
VRVLGTPTTTTLLEWVGGLTLLLVVSFSALVAGGIVLVEIIAGGNVGSESPSAACSNGVDDDSDSHIDFPADPECSSIADTDEYHAPRLPAPIQGTHYTLQWRDEFETFDTSRWNDHLRWSPCTPPAGRIHADAGTLHLEQAAGECELTQINTAWQVANPSSFIQPLYVELRVKLPAGDRSWPSAWFMNYQHLSRAPATGEQTSACTSKGGQLIDELDVIDNGAPGQLTDTLVSSLHKNTSGYCGVPDDQKGCRNRALPGAQCGIDVEVDLTTDFHRIAAWWTAGHVRVYVDDVLVKAFRTFPDAGSFIGTDGAPMGLLLGSTRGHYSCPNCGKRPAVIDTQFDYVRVYKP